MPILLWLLGIPDSPDYPDPSATMMHDDTSAALWAPLTLVSISLLRISARFSDRTLSRF